MTLKAKNIVSPFSAGDTEAICKVLADTEHGLTGSEIGHFLRQIGIEDPSPGITKWKRLYDAFAVFQNKHQAGNALVMFINVSMDPARYLENPSLFEQRRDSLVRILSLSSMSVNQKGKVIKASQAESISEARLRANRFKSKLQDRCVHPEVFQYCLAEIKAENYFHSVFEAMKSISSKVRSLSGLTGDGADLAIAAFSLGKSCAPILAINELNTETMKGEQRGFLNLLVGLFGTIRNPLAHEAKIDWIMSEQDALDVMSVISLVHRKLDNTKRL